MDAVLRILLQVVLYRSDIKGDELYGTATDREIEEIVAQGRSPRASDPRYQAY